MIRPADVETDMSIRADPAEKKTDPAQIPDTMFIFDAPLIDALEHFFLTLLQLAVSHAVAQTQIDRIIGPNVFQRTACSQTDCLAIDQLGFVRIQAEAFQVKFAYIVIEAVVLQRIDGIKLVDLNEMKI